MGWQSLDQFTVSAVYCRRVGLPTTAYRVFFAKDPCGVYFCLTLPLEPTGGA